MSLRIGVDIGGTNLRVGVVQNLQIVYEHRVQADFASICRSNSPDVAWSKIVEVMHDAIAQALDRHEEVSAIGIGFPGFIDPQTGILASSPNLPGLINVDLAKALSERIQRPVRIENDALVAAYGEYLLNKIPVSQGLIYMGLGTGVGGGLVQNGKAVPGEHGFAMEVGHIIVQPRGRLCGCGNYGCLEQYASATGVSKSYQEVTQQQLSAHEIAERAKQGDILAQEAYDIAAKAIAQALAHILKVVDVERVVIGGGVSQAWPLMQPAFDAQLNTDLIPVLRGKVHVAISSTQDQAGIVGAACLTTIN